MVTDDESRLSEAQITVNNPFRIVLRTVADREEEGTAAMKDVNID